MSEKFESTPMKALSIEGLQEVVSTFERKFGDALLEIEQYEESDSQAKAIEDAFHYSETLIEVKKLLGDRKREAVARMKTENEVRLDNSNFQSHEEGDKL